MTKPTPATARTEETGTVTHARGCGPAEAPTALALCTYAVQMLMGLVIVGFGARLLVRRAALVRTGAGKYRGTGADSGTCTVPVEVTGWQRA